MKEYNFITPDFYLPEFDMFIEIKGYWWGNDKEKMICVMKQYPYKKLIIVKEDDYLECIKMQS